MQKKAKYNLFKFNEKNCQLSMHKNGKHMGDCNAQLAISISAPRQLKHEKTHWCFVL